MTDDHLRAVERQVTSIDQRLRVLETKHDHHSDRLSPVEHDLRQMMAELSNERMAWRKALQEDRDQVLGSLHAALAKERDAWGVRIGDMETRVTTLEEDRHRMAGGLKMVGLLWVAVTALPTFVTLAITLYQFANGG